MKYFENWCGNIENKKAFIKYPVDDDEIQKLIAIAKTNGNKIRVVGSSHSSSPVVCDNLENIDLISLKNYRLVPSDIIIDDINNIVTVNAGWTLGQLYDHLNINRYFLKTQPASSAFTIGGIVSMPIHGCRLGASCVAETMMGITLIDMDGNQINKTEADKDFDLYRNSLGIFGIITSVSLKIEKINNLSIRVKCYENVFRQDGKINSYVVEDKLTEIITACYENDIKYHHSFMDFHNNSWTTMDWKTTQEEPYIYIDTPEIQKIHMVNSVEDFHKYIVPNYRKNKKYLKILGKIFTFSIVASVKKNSFEDHDMFWVATGTRVFFMSYFIPIHTEGDPIDLTKLYTALEIIYETVNKSKIFNIDFPCDIRFVTSSSKSIISPISREKKTIFMAVDLTCSAANIKFSNNETTTCFGNIFKSNNEILNKEFRNFYFTIEQKWIELGGVAHYAKIFGFRDSTLELFDPAIVSQIFPAEIKKIVQDNAQPLFMNNFVQRMFR